MGFWASKTLLSAVELGVFTALAAGPMTGAELEQALGLHPRATYDFLDALVALGLLARRGDGAEGRYMNTPATALYLDREQPALCRRHPRNGERPPLSLLGRSHPGASDRPAAERDQAFGQADVRRALRRSGPARAVHGRDDRRVARQFRGLRGEVRFLPLSHPWPISAAPPASSPRSSPPAIRTSPRASYDLPVVKPIAERRIAEAGLAGRVAAGGDRFPQRRIPDCGPDHHGDDPPRLESRA